MTDFVKLCLDMGADNAEELPMEKLVFEPSLRSLCEKNACGKYGRNYMCPPLVGDISELITYIKNFSSAVILQNIYKLEDSFDFEGMMAGSGKHNEMTRKIAEKVYRELGRDKALVLAAGCCGMCVECGALTGEKCAYPNEALASLEAYGINVSKISEVSKLKYINGANTVTYFSGIFY